MDRLWFHQIILLSQPVLLIAPPNLETPQPNTDDSSKSSSSSLSMSSLEDGKDGDISSGFSPFTDEANSSDSPPKTPKDDDEEKLISKKARPKRSSFAGGSRIIRSHSSSPSTKKRAEHLRQSGGSGTTKLEKSMSCKSLDELELKEVIGFMDLGFIFKEEHISPRMMSLLPGLQRLKVYKNKQINGSSDQLTKGNEIEEEEEGERGVIKPYLSEAWLIKRPGSPLINLRVPRVSAAADMKKHLKFWARTVASEIHQES
ncbi:hypothetical protein PanWU01x14_089830 [Parasponia andersonii]|uniref:Uncharacterized protein n=1 Tax=Parasponia andersonii TaxID=3476 RepID=A0A2P5D7I4_PARAD|nr:hypothetical protein PanWU01x14_089830 [Parasponia andersonii]